MITILFQVLEIIKNARDFVQQRLLPKDVYCYHVKLFEVCFVFFLDDQSEL